MSVHDSAVDPAALAYARALLKPPFQRERVWPALAAAAFAAVAALALAGAVLTAPLFVSAPPVKAKAATAIVTGPERSR